MTNVLQRVYSFQSGEATVAKSTVMCGVGHIAIKYVENQAIQPPAANTNSRHEAIAHEGFLLTPSLHKSCRVAL